MTNGGNLSNTNILSIYYTKTFPDYAIRNSKFYLLI